MSTKTTFKRIALVAVAALGAGVLSVAPANAAEVGVEGISITSSTATVNVGTAATTTFSLDPSAALANTDTIAVTPTVSVPTGSVITVGRKSSAAAVAGSTEILTNTGEAFTAAAAAVANSTSVYTLTASDATEAVSTVAGTISFTPDRPGQYVVTLTTAAAGSNTVKTATFTVTARSLSYTTGDATAQTPFNTGTGVAGVANTVTLTAYSTQVADQKALVTVSGSGATIQSASNSTVSADLLSTVVNAAASSAIVIKTPTAGTVTVSLFNETAAGSGLYSTTAANTVTITVNAAALNGVYSYAEAFISAGDDNAALPTADDATAISAVSTANATTPRATIAVRQYDNLDTLLLTAKTKAITVSISGAGSLGLTQSQATGVYLAVAAAGGANSAADDFYVYSDGRSGVGTITIAVNGVTVATKTVTFYGSVASYVVSTKNSVLSVGSSADTQVLTVQALDANGVAVPSATVHVSSGTTTVATVDSATVTTSAAGAAADIGINGVAKGSAVITVGNAATSPTVSATATISVVAAGIASVALSFDKAEYTSGEKATITITAKNADGELVGDQAYATLFATGGITASSSLTADLSAVSITTVNGVKTYSVFMPLASGPVTISATLGASVATAIQATVVTASTTVGASAAQIAAEAATDAAAEAIDAANAATDAANLAAEAADAATVAAEEARDAADAATAAVEELATQVATLMAALKAQITTLANTVAKIAKKVKA